MSGPNTELFIKVLAQIEKHPETWRQSTYRWETECGTAYCFAGWAAQISGAEWLDDPYEIRCGDRDGSIVEVADSLLGIHMRNPPGDGCPYCDANPWL